MLIAFEGPDNVGKSTSAMNLTHDGRSIYNATIANYHEARQDLIDSQETDLVVCFDRIDWFSHMVYRLALPGREWNDVRPRTVFAMPDTHLVVKLHHPDLANFTADEIVDTPIAQVNPMYRDQAEFLAAINKSRGYNLFKTVSIIEVLHDQQTGSYSQHLVMFDSPVFQWGAAAARMVDSDERLLELLQYDEQQRV